CGSGGTTSLLTVLSQVRLDGSGEGEITNDTFDGGFATTLGRAWQPCVPARGPSSAPAPDPDAVYVSSLTYGGTGCPQGAAATVFSPDRTEFSLLFGAYVAQTGPGLPITEARKACQINVGLHAP